VSRFVKIASGIDVTQVRLDLMRHPELWDEYTERKVAPMTPHAAMSDIWLRYAPRDELVSGDAYLAPFIPAFYPAWGKLPSLRPIVFNLAAYVQAVQIGGIMITRLPAGCVIEPHDDRGSWHAEFFNTKIYVPIEANDHCGNYCDGEGVVMLPGEAWTFDNQLVHSVENRGQTERIVLIVCVRVET